jgi:hypothetical protein
MHLSSAAMVAIAAGLLALSPAPQAIRATAVTHLEVPANRPSFGLRDFIVLTGIGPVTPSSATADAGHGAWFFVLDDDSTCTPLAGRGRELEGLTELYSCRFGSDGPADALLGDFDTSQPVWTIRKVLINKKTDPQTIKSFAMAAVKTVWN